MEFWGVEVKSGSPFEVKLGEGKVLHLSQACLGEIKNNKSESVCLHVTVEGKKLVLGTLHSERLPQQLFDLVFDKDFQISHNWKNGSVYFYGYKADQPIDDQDDSEELDTDEEEEALQLPVPNGKKEEAKKEEKTVVASKKDKQKVKIVEPEKEDKKADDDLDSDDSDSMSEDGSDSDEDNEDSSDSDDESDEDEETPKKPQSGKKRANESGVKTPATDNKKAKMSTPQKTDGKKAGGHVATPHPSKAVAKTPANKSNQKSPASASEGAVSCKPCNRSFKSDSALQAHNQAKHK